MLRLCAIALLAISCVSAADDQSTKPSINHPFNALSASTFMPYPIIPALPQAVYTVNYDGRGEGESLVIQTLQGALAKLALSSNQSDFNLLYKLTGNGTDINADSQYLYQSYYQKAYPAVRWSDRLLKADVKTILSTLYRTSTKQLITQYILCKIASQGESDSVNIGLSLAGVQPGVIVVTEDYVSLVETLGITMLQDVRPYDELSFIQLYQPFNVSGLVWPFNTRYIGCQTSHKATIFLTDWIMLTGSFQLHHTPTVTKVLPALYSGEMFSLLGWTADAQSENDMTEWVTLNGGMVWAADTVSNMATHAFFTQPTSAGKHSMTNPTRSDPNKRVDNRKKHTVAFLWSDGDALAADVNGAVTTDRWLNPNRGKIPQTWSLNPSLSHIAPSQLQYFYDGSVENDSIIGFTPGYTFPDMFPSAFARQNWAAVGAEAMNHADMGVNLLIGMNFTEYALEPLMAQYNVEGMIYFCYPNYYVLPENNGSVLWIHDKPVISIRDSMWDGHSTPQSTADLLNKQSRDHESVDGYSVIGVHMWSQTVDTVNKVASLLDDDVVVVKLDELVRLMTDNVKRSPKEPKSQTASE